MSKKNPLQAAKKKPLPSKKTTSSRQNNSKNSIKNKPASSVSAAWRITKSPNKKNSDIYRDIIENIQDGIFEVDIAGNLTFFNDSVCRVLGYSRKDLTGVNYKKFTDKKDFKRVYLACNQVYKSGTPIRELIWRIKRKNGVKRYIEGSIYLLKDSSGKPIGFRGIAYDINERKHTEDMLRQSEARYRLLADHMKEFVWLMDLNLNWTYISPSIEKYFGYTLEEVKQTPLNNLLTATSFQKAMDVFSSEMSKIAKTPPPPFYKILMELDLLAKNGRTLCIENTISFVLDEKGKPVSIIGEGRDITERKQMEKALCQSEGKYRTILENIEEGYFEVDLNGNYTFLNDALCGIHGYRKEELTGMNYRQYMDKATAKKALRVFNKVYETGKPLQEVVWQIIRKDGSKRHIDASASLIKDSSGKPTGFRGVVRDITEGKRTEDSLKETELKFRIIFESASDGIILLNVSEGKFSDANEKICNMLGYTCEELLELSIHDIHPQESIPFVLEQYEEVLKKEGYIAKDIPVIRKDKTVFFADISGSPITLGGKEYSLGIFRDITERKRAEAELLEEQQRFKALADQSSDIIVVVNREGNVIYENKSMEKVLGYKPKERIGSNALDNVHPDDKEFNTNFFKEIFKNKNVPLLRTEVRLRHQDGSWRIFEEVASGLSRNNIVESIIVNLRDITERKKAESQRDSAIEALRRSEKYFKEITENSSDIIIITDKNGNIKYCSRALERFIGYKPEEVIGKDSMSFIHQDDAKRAADDYVKALLEDDNTLIHNAFRIVHKNGSIVYLDGIGRNLLNNPDIEGFVMNVRDITESKQAEEKLRREEQRFRALADQSSEIIVLVNRDGFITYENPAIEKVLGYKPEERIGISAFDLIHPGDLKLVTDVFNLLFNDKKTPVQKAEIRLRHKDRSWHTFEAVASHLIHDNDIEFVIINLHDITERKKNEHALQESKHRYRELSQIDGLTQLYNSRHFYAQLKKEIERSNRYEQPLTLLLLDLDKFKDYNDTYGHVEGDHVLAQLGKVIKRCLRDTDSAYRYGGEEFTIMLPMTNKDEGIVIAKRIQAELSKEAFSPLSGSKVYTTVSIGLSQFKYKEEVKAFVHRVDQLMYKVKKTERGKICSDNENMQ
jgi:diguanylate cyclase (GGDEF)-like protein/PAS domain S-box-containing protein